MPDGASRQKELEAKSETLFKNMNELIFRFWGSARENVFGWSFCMQARKFLDIA